ncbi:uncharacterized protein LAESUDRAFT_731031 [Laetiporus sulphureus 93-53]|uniref:Uncharacterized protein n=1 Tax=Laetiporus sulphureus 93-53 TaxID=1314785 RepID=A0A165BTF8_9APHY|nr:uncharacterized protein LAESUDRAFT_731031 [Laetiporus sulphureus 93-53]KZT01618.1 hypothetical protein LAESUDRAFT_731031 [Laetiporus sulphureus 93-53]
MTRKHAVDQEQFIELAKGSEGCQSVALQSEQRSLHISEPFLVGETLVQLVEIPGFDDAANDDTDVLDLIAKCSHHLSRCSLKKGVTGIIYLHPITDNRMGRAALRYFNTFTALCGPGALSNAAIAFNMWNEVDEDVAERRSRELSDTELLFKPALDAGAKTFRHNNTRESARIILGYLAGLSTTRLAFQKEVPVSKRHWDVCDSSAGRVLSRYTETWGTS